VFEHLQGYTKDLYTELMEEVNVKNKYKESKTKSNKHIDQLYIKLKRTRAKIRKVTNSYETFRHKFSMLYRNTPPENFDKIMDEIYICHVLEEPTIKDKKLRNDLDDIIYNKSHEELEK
jgi:hypothetical protein